MLEIYVCVRVFSRFIEALYYVLLQVVFSAWLSFLCVVMILEAFGIDPSME